MTRCIARSAPIPASGSTRDDDATHARIAPCPSLVTIRNLTKTYQRGPEKVEVLHGIDLDIAKGDFVALMGPSGSGKTTLLNLIGGLDTPSRGRDRDRGRAHRPA